MNTNVSDQFETYFRNLNYSREPQTLYAPVEYTLSGGGKRLRPQLLILSYLLYKDNPQDVFAAAAGMEIFHNFTLLHDDVMDKAQMRRSRPTVHVKWNDNTAILSGDAMLVLAYRYLAQVPDFCHGQVQELINETFMEVMEGQQYDMDFETMSVVSVEQYMEMIRLKTSVLLAACMKLGAILAGAPQKDCEILYNIGINAGLAFQLQDDLLDVYGDPLTFGKNVGGDISCNKKTFMYINARLNASSQMLAELDRWEKYSGNDMKCKIDAVTDIYNKLGIKDICTRKIDNLFQTAIDLFSDLSVTSDRCKVLRGLIESMINRNR